MSNCIVVKGYNQSTICDLQRSKIFTISNDLAELLTTSIGKSMVDILQSNKEVDSDNIQAFFQFLQEKELIFFTDTPELFPEMSTEWYYPFTISNAILDIDENSTYNMYEAIEQLEEVFCENLQIRLFKEVTYSEIEDILLFLKEKESIITSVEFIFSIKKNDLKNVLNLVDTYPRISSFSIFNWEEDKVLLPKVGKRGFILFTKQNITSEKHCGVISKDMFNTNVKSFTESLKFNSCLNRKVSLDTKGFIKNCPSFSLNYGNIKTTKIKEVVEKRSFKKVWSINKDMIDTCKICEFRHVCNDCRAYTENPKDILSKPLKCGYNPKTGEWKAWTSKPFVKNIIKYYENN